MERLIHTSDGDLKVDDPFKVVEAKIGYNSWDSHSHGRTGPIVTGIITEEALRKARPISGQDPVWAKWSNASRVGWMPKEVCFVIEE